MAVWSEERAKELADKVRDLDVKIVSGMEGLIEVSTLSEVEILVTAIVGMIGIRPTIAAITAGKHIALANKETLVTAGHIIMPLAKEHGVSILPVDSEHSAIFQSLQGGQERALHENLAHSFRGAIPRKKMGRPSECAGGRCLETPELGDGKEDYDRFFYDGQQRAGSD